MNKRYICKVYFTYNILYIYYGDDDDYEPTQEDSGTPKEQSI